VNARCNGSPRDGRCNRCGALFHRRSDRVFCTHCSDYANLSQLRSYIATIATIVAVGCSSCCRNYCSVLKLVSQRNSKYHQSNKLACNEHVLVHSRSFAATAPTIWNSLPLTYFAVLFTLTVLGANSKLFFYNLAFRPSKRPTPPHPTPQIRRAPC